MIILHKEFNIDDVVFLDFITDYHSDIIQNIGRFHDGIGVVGLGIADEGAEWRWSSIRVTNSMVPAVTLEVITCLESLWVFGIRRVLLDENIPNPWRLVNGYNSPKFSGLQGPIELLGFSGKYRDAAATLNVTRGSLDNAILILDSYAEQLNNGENPNHDVAEKSFQILILYFAEALRILPIRYQLEQGFDLSIPMTLGRVNLSFARNWSTLSEAFFTRNYSLTVAQDVYDEDGAREILWLLLYSQGNKFLLNDVPPNDEQGDPEAGGGNPEAHIGNEGLGGNVGGDGKHGQEILGAGEGNLGAHVGNLGLERHVDSQGPHDLISSLSLFSHIELLVEGVALACLSERGEIRYQGELEAVNVTVSIKLPLSYWSLNCSTSQVPFFNDNIHDNYKCNISHVSMAVIVPITKLPNWPHSVRIQARTVRTWPDSNLKNGSIWYYSFVLMNSQGGVIQAKILVRNSQHLSNQLIDGQICGFSIFSVVLPKSQNHVLEETHNIDFTRQTISTPLSTSNQQIPWTYFDFKPLKDTGTCFTDENKIRDVIGRIAGFGKISDVRSSNWPNLIQMMHIANQEINLAVGSASSVSVSDLKKRLLFDLTPPEKQRLEEVPSNLLPKVPKKEKETASADTDCEGNRKNTGQFCSNTTFD